MINWQDGKRYSVQGIWEIVGLSPLMEESPLPTKSKEHGVEGSGLLVGGHGASQSGNVAELRARSGRQEGLHGLDLLGGGVGSETKEISINGAISVMF